jgi:photosystem II stability/assembly factor-like uncharacterized protein
MKNKFYFILCLFLVCFFCNSSIAQPRELKDVPGNYEKPYWMKEEYWNNYNVQYLDSIINDWVTSKKEKIKGEENPYLNAYKRWRNAIEASIGDSGKIEHTPINFKSIQAFSESNKKKVLGENNGSWKLIGPSNTFSNGKNIPWQSNIYVLAIDKKNPSIIYAGSETGHIFKTIDKGLNWYAVGEKIPFVNGSLTALAVATDNTSSVYAYANGLFKSNDGGNNWNQLFSYKGGYTEDIKINPSNGIIYIANDSGLLYSKDNGMSWLYATGTKIGRIYDVVVHSNSQEIVLAVGKDYSGNLVLLKSTDYGESFINITSTNLVSKTDGARLAVTKANPNVIYCIVLGEKSPRLIKSTNSGDSWKIISTSTAENLGGNNTTIGLGMSNGQGFYDLAICVSEKNADHVIVGTTSAYKSIDGGINFSPIGGYNGSLPLHPDIQCIQTFGNDTYIASDGGITYSSDFFTSLSNFQVRINGLSASDFWGFGQGWDEDIVVGGRYHNGNTAISEKYGTGNSLRLGGAEDATGHVFHGYKNTVGFRDIGVYVLPDSVQGTLSQAEIRNTLWPSDDFYGQFSSRLINDSRYRNVIYIGNGKSLWKSYNSGENYEVIYTFSEKVWRFDIARTNPNVIYLCTGNSIYKSSDAGKSWITLTLPQGVSFSYYNSDIVVNPSNENDVYISMSSNSNELNRVFNSTDGGVNWNNITGSVLKGLKVAYLQSDGTSVNGIYAITNFPGKVFYKNKLMTDWVNYSAGLPENITARQGSLIFFRDNKIRICGNRGIWESPLYQPAEPLAQPMSNKNIVNCFLDTVAFFDYSILNYAGAKWKWDFPGASFVSSNTTRSPKVLYEKPGKYDVSLTVTDSTGKTNTKLVKEMIVFEKNICIPDTLAGNALHVKKDSTVINIGIAPIYSNSFTITCWIKPNGLQNSFAQLVSHDPYPTSNFGFGLGFSFLGYTRNLNLCYTDQLVGYGNSSNLIADSTKWNHVALVYSPRGVTIYLNGKGVKVNSNSMPRINLSLSPFYINKDIHQQGGYYNGLIDEVKIYNDTLSQDEIRSKMHLINGTNQKEPNLIKYIQFNLIEANTLYDAVGNNQISIKPSNIVKSTAPVGTGTVTKIFGLSNGGEYAFANSDIKLTLNKSGNYTNGGDIYVTKLNSIPDFIPYKNLYKYRGNYWIINQFGTNPLYTYVDSIKFLQIPISGTGLNNQQFLLSYRHSGAFDSSWYVLSNHSDQIISSQDNRFKSIHFNTSGMLNQFGQFLLLDACFVDTTLQIVGKQNICKGDSVILLAGLADKYSWLKNDSTIAGATQKKFIAKEPGKYSVVLMNNNGYAEKSRIIIVDNANQPPPPLVNNIDKCKNELPFTLTAINNSGHTLQWYETNAISGAPSLIAPTISTGITGTINHYVAQTNTVTGCESERAKLTVVIQPTPDKPIITRDVTNNLISSAVIGNQWYKEGAILVGETSIEYKPKSTANYSVTSTQNNCTSLMSDNYYYLTTGIITLNGNKFIKILPNPTYNSILINFDLSGVSSINVIIFDLFGKRVIEKNNVKNNDKINLSNLKSGIYSVKFMSSDKKINSTIQVIKI